MARYEAIQKIMESIEEELIICNIGFPSRELYEIDDRPKNFYMIGSMGLASSIGFGLAMAKPHKDVVVIDGDGSLLMNMGSLVKAVGFKNSFDFTDINLKDVIRSDDASFIVYKTEPGNSDAPIIDLDPITIKERFMSSI